MDNYKKKTCYSEISPGVDFLEQLKLNFTKNANIAVLIGNYYYLTNAMNKTHIGDQQWT